MNAAVAAQIADVMNRMPEVRWDRYVDAGAELVTYGWIDREDGRADFLILTFWPGEATKDGIPCSFTTSSADLSSAFMERLYGTSEGHMDCQRVEHAAFGELVLSKIILGGTDPCYGRPE